MKKHLQQNQGFTLIETMVAIVILVITIGAIFSLAAGSIFSARYARNQITATYLLQESLESIRNDRDTAAQSPTFNWNTWISGFQSKGCMAQGCIVDPYLNQTLTVTSCSGGDCPAVRYFESGFYGYNNTYEGINSNNSYNTTFVRKIIFDSNSGDPNQYTVTGTITWYNGSQLKTLSQQMLITNWQP